MPLMNPFADPIGLGALGLGFSMFNVIQLQIELIRMFIQSPDRTGSPDRSIPATLKSPAPQRKASYGG
jgi:hypothetical protein